MTQTPVISAEKAGVLSKVSINIKGKNKSGKSVTDSILAYCGKKESRPETVVEEIEFDTAGGSEFDYFKVEYERSRYSDCEVDKHPALAGIESAEVLVEKKREKIDLGKAPPDVLQKVIEVRAKRLEGEMVKATKERRKEIAEQIKKEKEQQKIAKKEEVEEFFQKKPKGGKK